MSVVIHFPNASMTSSQYDEAVKLLEKAGQGSPKGRLYHICYGEEDELKVIDIWESKEDFDRFGKVLMPIAKQVDMNPGEPEITNVYKILPGKTGL